MPPRPSHQTNKKKKKVAKKPPPPPTQQQLQPEIRAESPPQTRAEPPPPIELAPITATHSSPPVRSMVYVATPCYGCLLTHTYMSSVLGLQAALSKIDVGMAIDLIGNESLVTRARNILVRRFLNSSSTHLLFIDADIGFDPNIVERLLKAEKDVAVAVYPKKHIDWSLVKRKAQDVNDEEPIHAAGLDFNINLSEKKTEVTDGFCKVLDAATGFMLIRRQVIERMYEAYRDELYCVNDLANRDVLPDYVALFDCMICPKTRRNLSEDYAFCRRWQAIGGEIYADLQSPLLHQGSCTFEANFSHRLVSSGHQIPGVDQPVL